MEDSKHECMQQSIMNDQSYQLAVHNKTKILTNTFHSKVFLVKGCKSINNFTCLVH
uniref:Uncharacterized protein n=1 Tax=Rhizophora mucronata TaxID=61149 RepID=A0A2P2IIW8_RHIMU